MSLGSFRFCAGQRLNQEEQNMNDTLTVKDSATVEVVRYPKDNVSIKGHFTVEHIRDGVTIGTYDIDNSITVAGKEMLLNAMFNGGSPTAPPAANNWYMGLVDGATSPSYNAITDTYASHGGWTENTDYSGGRQIWGAGAATNPTSSTVTTANASAAVFNMTGSSDTIAGLMIVAGDSGVATPGNTTATGGILWSAASFAANVATISGDQLKVTYSVSV